MRNRGRFAIGLALAACIALAGCDWAQIGFGSGNTGTNPLEAALTEASVAHLHVAWSTACNCSKPLVVGGTTYVVETVPTGSVDLRAFDAVSGALRWSTVVGVNMPGITVDVALDAVANGLAYVRVQRFGLHGAALESGRVVAYDATTGTLRWSVTPPAAGSGAATLGPNLIVDGTVAYVATNATASAELSAIDADGRVLWSVTPGGLGGAVAADPGLTVSMLTYVIVTSSGRSTAVPVLSGYEEGLGQPRSTVLPEIGPVGVAHIAFANGLIYGFQSYLANSGGVGLFAVNPNTGARAWSTGDNGLGPVGSRLVGPAVGAALLIARDAVSGTLTWQISTPGGPIDPAVAGGLVYFGAGTALRVVRLSDGGAAGSATPAANENVRFVTPSNGRVFVATTGHLVALAP